MMKAEGYDEDFSVGITLSTAVQSILIPPSHNMVIYAMVAGGRFRRTDVPRRGRPGAAAGHLPHGLLGLYLLQAPLSCRNQGFIPGGPSHSGQFPMGIGHHRHHTDRRMHRHLHSDGSCGARRGIRLLCNVRHLPGDTAQADREHLPGRIQDGGECDVPDRRVGGLWMAAGLYPGAPGFQTRYWA